MLGITLVKIVIAITLVLGLIYASEKVSPRVAGIIGGTAIGGTSVALFFFGLEHGVEFVQQAVPWVIAGLGAELFFYLGYYLGSKIFSKKFSVQYHMLGSVLVGFGFFLSLGYLLSILSLNLLTAIGIFGCFYILVNFAIRRIDSRSFLCVNKVTVGEKVFRVVFVSILIVLITSVPAYLGNRWAGIFSAFATTTFPVLLILQYKHGEEAVSTVIKNISWSIGSLVFYVISIYFFYDLIGIYLGTVVSFILSACFLFFIKYIFGKINAFDRRDIDLENDVAIRQMNDLWFR